MFILTKMPPSHGSHPWKSEGLASHNSTNTSFFRVKLHETKFKKNEQYQIL